MSPDPAIAALRARQESALARAVRRHYWKSDFTRQRIERAGLTKGAVDGFESLARLAPVELGDFAALRDSFTEAPMIARGAALLPDAALPGGYRARDVRRLAVLGARLLEAAGLARGDVAVDLLSNARPRDREQLRGGATQLKVSLVSGVTEVRQLELLGAGTVIGTVREVNSFLGTVNPVAAGVIDTAIVVGDVTARQRRQLVSAADAQGAVIVEAWAPVEAYAAWGTCRGASQFHTWPEDEIVEVVDPLSGLVSATEMDGRILLTWLGATSSNFLRIGTGAFARLHDDVRCPTCGRPSARLTRVEHPVSFGGRLDAEEAVESWSGELHETPDGDELVIFVAVRGGASSLSVVDSVERFTNGARVHIVSREEIARMVDLNKGERFGDRRAFAHARGSE